MTVQWCAATSRVAPSRPHESAVRFPRVFDPFAVIDEMLAALGETRLTAIRRALEEARRELTPAAPGLRPCHNDPWPGNLIDTGATVLLVDWEYSGMNDPAWDLAALSVEADLDAESERVLLDASVGGGAPQLLRRLALFKPVVDLLWSAWSLVELGAGNTADNFAAEAARRLARAEDALRAVRLEPSA